MLPRCDAEPVLRGCRSLRRESNTDLRTMQEETVEQCRYQCQIPRPGTRARSPPFCLACNDRLGSGKVIRLPATLRWSHTRILLPRPAALLPASSRFLGHLARSLLKSLTLRFVSHPADWPRWQLVSCSTCRSSS